MLKNYFKIALRTLYRHRGYAFINLGGLAVGMGCFLLILLYVRDELSYDRYHDNADRVYRVTREWFDENGASTLQLARISAPIGPALEATFPEVRRAVRLMGGDGLVSRGDRHFSESRLYYAEPGVFDVFTIPFVRGRADAALAEPFSVVLTETLAEKYFGAADPLGQVLRLHDEHDLRVTGVVEDAPPNTHFHYNALISFATLESLFAPEDWNNWGGYNNFATYLLLAERADAAALEARLPAFLASRYTVDVGSETRLHLQRLSDIHLHSHLDTELEPNGDVRYVYLFAAIAFFILVIACINFMNLATARSARRAREVGLRKVLGARRKQLLLQFLGESMLLTLAALAMAVALVELVLPAFNDFTGKALHLLGRDGLFMLLSLAGTALFAGLTAGSYPAFFLSGFQPTTVLKQDTGRGRARLRTVLVVAQFAISIALIICVGVVSNQLDYLQHKRLGFDQDRLVVLPATEAMRSDFAAVRDQLLANPGVESVTASQLIPSQHLVNQINVRAEVGGVLKLFTGIPLLPVDHDFLTTYGVELAAGRTFSKERASDSTEAVILNETAVRQLGWASPEAAVGQRFTLDGNSLERTGRVIGVVKDFHFESLHERIAPLVLFIMPDRYNWVTARIAGQDLSGTLAFLARQWQQYRPNYPFTYQFVDQNFAQLYQAEARLRQVFGLFALLAVFIACLGLFGLAAFTAERRTKEIGVRKVLGATIPGIVVMLSKEFVRLVLVAFAIAAPVAYLGMHRWLEGFAYHIRPSLGTVLVAGLLALAIAWLTVSYQAIKAALADPVKSLRYE